MGEQARRGAAARPLRAFGCLRGHMGFPAMGKPMGPCGGREPAGRQNVILLRRSNRALASCSSPAWHAS